MSTPTDESGASTLVRCSSPPHDDGWTAAEALVDELLLEIISRVPTRDRWRCKQVCKRWLCLAKTLPQSLAGFFYNTYCMDRFPMSAIHFLRVAGDVLGCFRPTCPSLDFLPNSRRIDLLDCLNGLLLCCLWGTNGSFYVVCNPATQEWVTLPDRSLPGGKVNIVRLGFDPAASPHFHVFLFLEDACIPGDDLYPRISGVDLYSSKTGKWVRKEKRWDQDACTTDTREETAFLNGYLHFHAYIFWHDYGLVPCLAAVATDGETWTTISVPTLMAYECGGIIQMSQGRLHYACLETDEDDADDLRLAVYVLEGYDSKQWKLKHRGPAADMFGRLVDRDDLDGAFDWIGIHPECNVIFFAAGDPKQFMCYNLDLQKVKVMRRLRDDNQSPYLPYVPLYIELQSLRM